MRKDTYVHILIPWRDIQHKDLCVTTVHCPKIDHREEKWNRVGSYSICVIGYCDVRCVCVYYCSTVKHDHQRTVSSSHFHRNCVVYIYDMHLLTIHRAVPICSCAICMTSSCYDSVVCASRYNAITSIWLSGATDNVERTLQEPHHRVTDELYSCSLP